MGFPRSTRRLIAALCTLVISFTILAGGASAAPRSAPETGNIQLAVEENCHSVNVGQQTGYENTTSSSSYSRSGAKAVIDVSATQFDICNNYILNAGPSAWVGIQPKNPWGAMPHTQIMQLGIIECGGGLYAGYCQGENNPHYVVGYGNCTTGVGIIQDLGPADTLAHTFSIYLMPDNNWYFSIDGIVKWYIPDDPYVDCWTRAGTDNGIYHDGLRKAVWAVERFNEGDSVGGNSAIGERTYFTDARYGVYNQGWFNPNLPSPCMKIASDDRCARVTDDTFYVYTAY